MEYAGDIDIVVHGYTDEGLTLVGVSRIPGLSLNLNSAMWHPGPT